MRRRIASLLGATLVLSALSVLAPAPASADNNVCVGQGTANVGPGLTYPVTVETTTAPTVDVRVRQPRTAGFAFLFGIGTCAPDLNKQLTAGGTLTGWCGHSSGQGTTSNGHNFAFVSAASFLIITGEVVGIVNAVPDPLAANNSCNSSGGANRFLVTGAVALVHCPVAGVVVLTAIPITATLTVTTVGPLTVGVHTGPLSEHVRICA
jgi:hypothetical protein